MTDEQTAPVQSAELSLVAVEPTKKELAVPDSFESLMGLFSPFEISKALSVSQWTIGEEVAMLTEIARGIRDGEGLEGIDDRPIRMRAAKELRALARESLEMAGVMARGKASRQIETDDGTITQEMTVMKMLGPDLRKAIRLVESGEYRTIEPERETTD